MLQELPEDTITQQVLAAATEDDRLAFGPRELYWLPKGLMLDSGWTCGRSSASSGGWTMRTKGTIERIAARFFAV